MSTFSYIIGYIANCGNPLLFFPFLEINATGFNYQNEDEKVTLSFPSTLQKGKSGLELALLLVVTAL